VNAAAATRPRRERKDINGGKNVSVHLSAPKKMTIEAAARQERQRRREFFRKYVSVHHLSAV